MMKDYSEFLATKFSRAVPSGFKPKNLNPYLKPFQADLSDWFCRLGRASCNAATGLGKSLMELAVAEQVVRYTGKDALIVTPLAVAQQFLSEAEKFNIGMDVTLCREAADVKRGINVINYDRLHKLDPSRFIMVAPDESSVMKHIGSQTRHQLIDMFRLTPYKLPATATPAPNDYMELGNQSEFCGWMSRAEMLATFFVHDSGDTAKWRLRKHAEVMFWKWMASWAAMVRKPSDLGYDNEGYDLPPLQYHEHVVETESAPGWLFPTEAKTLADQREARRDTINERTALVADLANKSTDKWIVWCNLNDESKLAAKSIPDSIEVTGSQSVDEKEEKLTAFLRGQSRVLVTKASIAGFGLNMQLCHNMAFLGMDHSFESWFQAIRRCWRFGQTCPVDVHVIVSDRDAAIVANIRRKESDYERMMAGMASAMQTEMRKNVRGTSMDVTEYKPQKAMTLPSWI